MAANNNNTTRRLSHGSFLVEGTTVPSINTMENSATLFSIATGSNSRRPRSASASSPHLTSSSFSTGAAAAIPSSSSASATMTSAEASSSSTRGPAGGVRRSSGISTQGLNDIKPSITPSTQIPTLARRRNSPSLISEPDGEPISRAAMIRNVVSHPIFRWLWFRAVFVAVVYVVVELPVDFAFDLPIVPWILFDLAVLAIFAGDVVVNWFQPYLNEEDEYEMDPVKIRQHYIRGWLILDLLAALPLDLVVFIFAPDVAGANHVQLIRLLKTLRLVRAIKILDTIQIKGLPAWMQLWVLVALFLLCTHWCACGFWKVAEIEGFANSWVTQTQNMGDLTTKSALEQYSWSFYWALATCTTLGYGDIHPVSYAEVVYATFVIFLGAAFYAVVIAGVGGHVVSTRFAAKIDYTRYMDSVEAFERHYNLPVAVRKRMGAYYAHLWNRQASFVDHEILEHLPLDLRYGVLESVFSKLVKSSHFLSHCRFEFQHELMSKLKWHRVRIPGDVLFTQGDDMGAGLYFVRRGKLELLVYQSERNCDLVVAKRAAGQHAGDLGFFNKQFDLEEDTSDMATSALKRAQPVTCVVVEHSELFSVSEMDVVSLFEMFPKEGRLFRLVAEQRQRVILDLIAAHERHCKVLEDEADDTDGDAEITGRKPSLEAEFNDWVAEWTKLVSVEHDERNIQNALTELVGLGTSPTIEELDGEGSGNLGALTPLQIRRRTSNSAVFLAHSPGGSRIQHAAPLANCLSSFSSSFGEKCLCCNPYAIPGATVKAVDLDTVESIFGRVPFFYRKRHAIPKLTPLAVEEAGLITAAAVGGGGAGNVSNAGGSSSAGESHSISQKHFDEFAEMMTRRLDEMERNNRMAMETMMREIKRVQDGDRKTV